MELDYLKVPMMATNGLGEIIYYLECDHVL